MKKLLRRYTELPFVIDYLKTKELTLLNTSTWDDKNDAYFIEQYAQSKSLQSTNALCLTEGSETYHHWKVFSHGSSGACVEFNKRSLLQATRKIPNLRAERVEYCTIQQLRDDPINEKELPFLKRHAFRDEEEFRLFHESESSNTSFFRVKVPISAINRIILSPWLPKEVTNNVKNTLKSIPGCSSLKIYRSTLVDNARWKKQAKNFA